jgi:type IV pilus biogenesis protein CpaD/CtpE
MEVPLKAILLAASLPLLAACVAAPGSGVPAEEKRYATGSNIPMRNRDVHTMTPEAFENARNSSTGNTGRPRGN